MRTLALSLVTAVMLPLMPLPALAQDASALEYKVIKGFAFEDPLISSTTIYLQPRLGRPADVKGAPSDAQGQLRYFAGTVHSREIVVAMDSATPPNVFVGRGGGSDLAGARPLARTKVPGASAGVQYQYGPVCLKAPHADASAGEAAAAAPAAEDAVGSVWIASLQDSALAMYPTGYLAGRMKVGDKTYQIALVDGNFDGEFAPPDGSAREFDPDDDSSDLLAIDLNGDDRFSHRRTDEMEVRPLTRMLCLADTYYEVKLARDSSNIRMVRAEPKTGTLAVNRPGVELMLMGPLGPQPLQGPKSSWRLPEGRYTCRSIKLIATDAGGAKWALEAWGDTGKLKSFEVKSNKTVEFDLGAPLSIKMDVQQHSTGWLFRGKEVSVGFTIVGASGEAYSPGAEKNGSRVPAPKITIYNEKDEMLASGDFEYG